MEKILVTGGCGYIGSHTIVDLVANGFEVICVDNNVRSSPRILEGVEKITGKKIKNYKVDLCNYDDTFAIFQENANIKGIIHFAAYKAVGESVEHPLMYFENNLLSLINLLKCVQEFEIPYFVFSSSCTVYGNPDSIPVTELTPPKPAESPYGYTKQMGEQINQDHSPSIFQPRGCASQHPDRRDAHRPTGQSCAGHHPDRYRQIAYAHGLRR
jgi:UDP-glucose 4-epimerase